MGSLEDKVARLSPEQRSEAETFIDFLLQKGGSSSEGVTMSPFLASEPAPHAAPSIILAEETNSPPAASPVNNRLPTLGDLQIRDAPHVSTERSYPANRSKRKDPGLLLDWID